MTPPAAPAAEPGPSADAGSYTLLTAVLALMFLVLAGLVVDGGAKLRAGQRADNLAQEAARAGAGQIDRSRAYATGRFQVDPAAAVTAAHAYLASAGHDGSVVPLDGHRIKVTVTISSSTVLLQLVGIGSFHVSRSATADLLSGVEGPGK